LHVSASLSHQGERGIGVLHQRQEISAKAPSPSPAFAKATGIWRLRLVRRSLGVGGWERGNIRVLSTCSRRGEGPLGLSSPGTYAWPPVPVPMSGGSLPRGRAEALFCPAGGPAGRPNARAPPAWRGPRVVGEWREMSQDNIGNRAPMGSNYRASANLQAANWNLPAPELYERADHSGRGPYPPGAARSSRSPVQHTQAARLPTRFIVCDSASDKQVWWDQQQGR